VLLFCPTPWLPHFEASLQWLQAIVVVVVVDKGFGGFFVGGW